jgi:hypothetical protein
MARTLPTPSRDVFGYAPERVEMNGAPGSVDGML